MRVRRALAPVLVHRSFVGLVARLRRAARDPALPSRCGTAGRPALPRPLRARGPQRSVGSRAGDLAGDDAARPVRSARARRGDRAAARALHAGHPGSRRLCGHRLSLGALEPRARARRASRGGGRDGLLRDPVRAGGPAEGRVAGVVSANRTTPTAPCSAGRSAVFRVFAERIAARSTSRSKDCSFCSGARDGWIVCARWRFGICTAR